MKQMKEEIDLRPTQPATHLAQSHWRQWLLCQDYTLQRDQLQQFYEYFRQCNILFDKSQRWDLFKELYSIYFQQEPKLQGRQWMRLGFQGKHPNTDLRGGGVFSLKLILRFVQTNKPLVQQMQVDKGNFFFAITSINIFFFMKNFFHLSDQLIPHRDQARYCSRRALKNFCQLIVTEREAIQKMHEMFLKHFYLQIWIKQKQQNQLLQFNELFDRFKQQIKGIFENHNINDYQQFLILWNHK